MRLASEYLAEIKAPQVLNGKVRHLDSRREEANGATGLFRFQLEMVDGSQLEIFERFTIVTGEPRILKYSYHWQTESGSLLRRWDNAPHHPEIESSPDHMHDGSELVVPHGPLTLVEVLDGLSLVQPSETAGLEPGEEHGMT